MISTTVDTRRLLLTDALTWLMCLLYAALSFMFPGPDIALLGVNIPRGILFGLGFVGAAVLIPAVPRLFTHAKNRVLRWLRIFYIQIFYLIFFSESIHLTNVIFGGKSFDGFFVDLETAIFGFQPALELYKALPESPFITELFFFSYFFYFLLFSIGIWILFFQGKEKAAYRFLIAVTIGFYILYLVYIVFPVKGPKYYFESLHALWYDHFEGFLFTAILKTAFDGIDLYGAAFPSSHAAISVLALLINFKYSHKRGFILLPITLALLVSTVYIYAHYAVDIFAGIIVGAIYFVVLPPLIEKVLPSFEKWEKKTFRALYA